MLDRLSWGREKLDGFRDGLGQPGLLFRCKGQKLHPGLLSTKILDRRNLLCGAIVNGAGRGREFEAQELANRQALLRLDRAAASRNVRNCPRTRKFSALEVHGHMDGNAGGFPAVLRFCGRGDVLLRHLEAKLARLAVKDVHDTGGRMTVGSVCGFRGCYEEVAATRAKQLFRFHRPPQLERGNSGRYCNAG